MDISIDRLRYLDDVMPANVHTVFSDAHMIRYYTGQADLIIGAVLIAGAKAPTLIPQSLLATMQRGAVIVDVCVDQGGCCETTRPTTHSDPIYEVDEVIHYCVGNIPGAVGRTSTFALCNATLPYALRLARLGYRAAAAADPGLALGINLQEGKVTNRAVAETFDMEFRPPVLQ
jgi:alanine dehydrogenase